MRICFVRRHPPLEAPAGRLFWVLFRAGMVNSPDRIEVRSAHGHDHHIDVDLELRVFEGLLGGNIQSTAVVQLDLGALQPGTYELSVTVHTLGFQRINEPDSALPQGTSIKKWTFDVGP